MIHLTLSLLLHAASITAGAQDYATAFKQTTETGRPLVVLIGADWCPGCRQMKNSALPEVEKQGGLSKVAFAYVNTDQDSELANKLMQGTSIPQLVLYQKTATGWRRQQMTGARSPGEIKNFLGQATAEPVTKLSSHKE